MVENTLVWSFCPRTRAPTSVECIVCVIAPPFPMRLKLREWLTGNWRQFSLRAKPKIIIITITTINETPRNANRNGKEIARCEREPHNGSEFDGHHISFIRISERDEISCSIFPNARLPSNAFVCVFLSFSAGRGMQAKHSVEHCAWTCSVLLRETRRKRKNA